MKPAPPYKLEVRSQDATRGVNSDLTVNDAMRLAATDVPHLQRANFRIRDSIRRGEARKLEGSLSALPFVKDARFDAHCEVLTVGLVGGQGAADSVKRFLDERAVRVVRDDAGAADEHGASEEKSLPLGVFLCVLALIAGAVHTYGSFLSPQVRDLALNLQAILAGSLIGWAGLGALRTVLHGLLRWRLRPETLPMLAGAGLIVASIVTFFKGGTPGFEAGLVAFGGSLLLVWLTERGRARSRVLLTGLSSRLKGQAMVLGPDGLFRVPRESVQAGDMVIVGPQDVIPADGIVQEGSAFLGEAVPSSFMAHKQCGAGDRVWAGMHVATGNVAIRVDGRNRRSSLAQVFDHMRGMGSDETWVDRRLQSLLIRYSGILLASAVGLVWAARQYGGWLGDVDGLHSAMSVVLVAVPFVFARPYTGALLDAACALASRGAIPRDLQSVRTLSVLEAVQVRADGTLTCGKPEVEACVMDPSSSREEVLGVALALTEEAEHGLHRCLNRFARQGMNDVNAAPTLSGTASLGYLGRLGHSDAEPRVALVEARECKAWGIHLLDRPWRNSAGEERGEVAIRGEATNQAVLYLVQGDQILARFHIFDPIRAEARETVRSIEGLGLSVSLELEGDPDRAATIAGDVGIALQRPNGTPPTDQSAGPSTDAHFMRVVGQRHHEQHEATIHEQHEATIRFGGGLSDVSMRAQLSVLNDSMMGVTSGLTRLRAYELRMRRTRAWALLYAVPSTVCAGLGFLPLETAATMSLAFSLLLTRRSVAMTESGKGN
jgi:cation transport ATPase